MEQLLIENISLSDCQIKAMSLSENKKEINIITENAIRLSDTMRFDETQIKIKNWTKLCVSKYVSANPFSEGKHHDIDWVNKFETFDSIDEIIINENATLLLNGYIKGSDGWLTYEFFEFEYEINAK